jgi:hypothetical protein
MRAGVHFLQSLRRAGRRAGVVACVALALGGCASSHGLIDALERNYQGYEELSPKLSPGPTGASFPYTPGTILPVSAVAGERDQRTWVATTDLRCGPGVTLQSLHFWQRKAYHYRNGQSTGADAQAWLDRRTGFASASLVGVSDVVVDVSRVRSYEPSAQALAELNARASSGCVLPVGLTGSGIRRVRGVIVGTVRVRLYFAQGVDLIARAQVTEQLAFALGFGFERLSESEIVGRDVAFGVKWQ